MNDGRKNENRWRPSLRDTRGASFVEYLMVVGIVALGLILAFKNLRRREDTVIARQGEIVRTLQISRSPQFVGLGSTPDEEPPKLSDAELARLIQAFGGCFAAGTPVATGEGKRPIETIHEGDLLWSRDEATGIVDLRPVLKRFVTPEQHVVQLRIAALNGGEILRPTPGHRFWVTGEGWVPAQSLTINGGLWSASGEPLHVAVPPVPIVTYETVYNFEVADFHTYFVGEHGILVHNGAGKKKPTTQQGPPPVNACAAGLTPGTSTEDPWDRLARELQQLRTKAGVTKTDRGGGTVAVAATDIPGLEGKVYEGASPNARPNMGPAQGGPFQSPNPSPRFQDHAEEDIANQIDKDIQSKGITPDQMEGKTVQIYVEQRVCNICRQGFDSPGIPDGVLKQMSEKYPGLRIEIRNTETSEVIVIEGGRRIR
ncbi:MAG TPA: polymorphic toxin-type HINT domain-containing protein [Polyangiaceae bacterium]